MPAKIRIPTPLRGLTAGAAEVDAEGSNVAELLDALERRHRGFKERLYDENGRLRRFISVFLNSEDIRNLNELDTPVKEGDEISIIPAIAGGATTAAMSSVLSASQLRDIYRHAAGTYPEECCGLVVGRPDGARRVIPCHNIQNLLHQEDPKAHPRDARSAYHLDPRELLLTLNEASARGEELLIIYHSHPDHGPHFSAEDRRQALVLGAEPAYPEAAHLVVSVRRGEVEASRLYRWDPAGRDFIEVPLAPQLHEAAAA